MKTCVKCKEEKSTLYFSKAKWSRDGFNTVCKKCKNTYLQKWNSLNPEEVKKRAKSNHLKRTYGISDTDYNTWFSLQKGSCAICKKHQSELKKPLYVDHCHATQEVRGLLCQHCNSLLGFAKDNKEVLQRAISYLEGF